MRTTWVFGFMMAAAFVSSAEAQTIDPMTGVAEDHCSVAQASAPDGRTVACQVWDHDPEEFTRPVKIEIYHDRRIIATIKPGEPIAEWHYWKKGEQISVHAGDTYRLYNTTTGRQIAQAAWTGHGSDLPAWAKDRLELEDESVPEGPAYVQQRTLWIAKVLRQIKAIHPGITRRDLESIMTHEGGLSTRQRERYVYKGCPYIKVDVVFAPTGADTEDDPIVSISAALPAIFRDGLNPLHRRDVTLQTGPRGPSAAAGEASRL